MVSFRSEMIDIFSIAFGVLYIAFILFNVKIDKPEYVPNAVSGLATMSGILTAFIGFWFTFVFSHASEQSKKFIGGWRGYRLVALVIALFIGLVSVIGGLSSLVQENYNAFQITLAGTGIILTVLFDVAFLIFVNFLFELEHQNPSQSG